MPGGQMADPQTAGLRAQLYELSHTAKELAEAPDIGDLSTDDASFIQLITVTLINMKNKKV
jgi:hypothetical protein